MHFLYIFFHLITVPNYRKVFKWKSTTSTCFSSEIWVFWKFLTCWKDISECAFEWVTNFFSRSEIGFSDVFRVPSGVVQTVKNDLCLYILTGRKNLYWKPAMHSVIILSKTRILFSKTCLAKKGLIDRLNVWLWGIVSGTWLSSTSSNRLPIGRQYSNYTSHHISNHVSQDFWCVIRFLSLLTNQNVLRSSASPVCNTFGPYFDFCVLKYVHFLKIRL